MFLGYLVLQTSGVSPLGVQIHPVVLSPANLCCRLFGLFYGHIDILLRMAA